VDYLPLFADLKARPVLVVGGGDIAARKISLLRRAGAVVRIVAKKLAAELQRDVDAGHVEWLAQAFDEQQLDQVFLLIAAPITANSTAGYLMRRMRAIAWLTWWTTSRCAPLFSLRLLTARRWLWPFLPAVMRRCWRVCCAKK